MIGIALSLLAMVVLAMVALSLGMKLMQNYKPGRNKIQKDLQQMRAELAPLVADLIPLTSEEMEQLSFNQIKRSTKNGMVKSSKGVITTIYHEPVVAWAYRKYVSKGENGLLYARTSNQEFIYRVKNGEVEMVIGDQLVGTVNDHGVVVSQKGNKPLAQVSQNYENQVLPLKVNDKRVGGLSNPAKGQKGATRIFQHLTKLEKEEEELVLSLSILEAVKREAVLR
ncbi:MAG: hypothetical protein IT258_21430 [Saprospiraceae bacterium]|nr:hypothetical protein [Saprospiraceae bacterium]